MAERFSRRQVLRGLGVGAAAWAAGSVVGARSAGAPGGPPGSPLLFHSPDVVPFRGTVSPPPVVTGPSLSISAVNSRHRFHPDLPEVDALAYRAGDVGPGYLGPTIEAQADELLTLRYTNDLAFHPLGVDMDTSVHGVTESFRTAPPTSLHLHGGVTPPASDGHPEQVSRPGRSLVHGFPNGQEASHLWYHDHAMGITRVNVYSGLAGMYLLRDRWDTGRPDNPLGLPAGEFEMPLVLQEKIFRQDGTLSIRSTPIVPEGSWEGGAVGDVGLVNGAVWPEIPVARGLYRFRVVNAASYSVWNLHFSTRMRFWVIGNDCGLLDAPVPVTQFRVAPGERYDLLVDFSLLDTGGSVELRNDEHPPFQAAVIGAVLMPVFCRFAVGSARGFTGQVPSALRGGRLRSPLPALPVPDVVRTVTVSQPYALRNPPAIMTLNNLRFADTDIEKPRAGTTERWDIVNVTPDPHPIHIHLVHFRTLGRTPLRTVDYQAAHLQPPVGIRWAPDPTPFLAGPSVPPEPWEAGWKDTVRSDGGTVTSVLVRFPTADELGFDPDALFDRPDSPESDHAGPTGADSEPSAPTHHGVEHPAHNGVDHGSGHGAAGPLQGYVWHCHILDHEDHDMMLKYRVVP
ncbi:multicopper oxidase family protein [Rhodococcoides corynebacterioides]|uniref:multicopper oxidase family protein n=1 Tax=Rhodococcoides corynebacterioides TaxID=53972 RepID=UPI003AE776DE